MAMMAFLSGCDGFLVAMVFFLSGSDVFLKCL